MVRVSFVIIMCIFMLFRKLYTSTSHYECKLEKCWIYHKHLVKVTALLVNRIMYFLKNSVFQLPEAVKIMFSEKNRIGTVGSESEARRNSRLEPLVKV